MEKARPLIYTIGCPKCKALERLFKSKGIEYDVCTDVQIMVDKGFEYLPQMEYEGEIYDVEAAEEWAENYKGE